VIGRLGDPGNVGQVGGGAEGQWGVTALHQKVSVVDDTRSAGGGGEERSPGGGAVVTRQLRLVRQGYSADLDRLVRRLFSRRTLRLRHSNDRH